MLEPKEERNEHTTQDQKKPKEGHKHLLNSSNSALGILTRHFILRSTQITFHISKMGKPGDHTAGKWLHPKAGAAHHTGSNERRLASNTLR